MSREPSRSHTAVLSPSYDGAQDTCGHCRSRSSAAVCTDFAIRYEVVICGTGSEQIGLTAEVGKTELLVIYLD